MAPHSQSSPLKFLELSPSQPSQPVVPQPPTVVKDTEMLMASPSQPATFTNFLELSCSAPTQPASSPSPRMMKQNQTLLKKGSAPKATPLQLLQIPRGRRFPIRKPGVRRRIPHNCYGHGFTPVFRTEQAAKFFGVTMEKDEDGAEKVTDSDCEREEKESRKRSPSPDVAEKLPNNVLKIELELAKTVAAHAGRKNVKRKDIEIV